MTREKAVWIQSERLPDQGINQVACMGSIQAKDPDCSAKRPMLEIYEMTKDSRWTRELREARVSRAVNRKESHGDGEFPQQVQRTHKHGGSPVVPFWGEVVRWIFLGSSG